MKRVFVLGFFDPVQRALGERYAGHLDNGSIITIRQVRPGGEANIGDFASRFNDQLRRGATATLVLLAVPRGREWIVDVVEKMLAQSRHAYPQATFTLISSANTGNRELVLESIEKFDLPAIADVSCAQVQARIGSDGRVLCMSMEGRTTIRDALQRTGFALDAISTCFHEERIAGARNSNLMDVIGGYARTYGFLLYAWDGLRTLKPETKAKFAKCYEAQTASKVVDTFKRWILDGKN